MKAILAIAIFVSSCSTPPRKGPAWWYKEAPIFDNTQGLESPQALEGRLDLVVSNEEIRSRFDDRTIVLTKASAFDPDQKRFYWIADYQARAPGSRLSRDLDRVNPKHYGLAHPVFSHSEGEVRVELPLAPQIKTSALLVNQSSTKDCPKGSLLFFGNEFLSRDPKTQRRNKVNISLLCQSGEKTHRLIAFENAVASGRMRWLSDRELLLTYIRSGQKPIVLEKFNIQTGERVVLHRGLHALSLNRDFVILPNKDLFGISSSHGFVYCQHEASKQSYQCERVRIQTNIMIPYPVSLALGPSENEVLLGTVAFKRGSEFTPGRLWKVTLKDRSITSAKALAGDFYVLYAISKAGDRYYLIDYHSGARRGNRIFSYQP